jgi:hypothetical protein
MVGLVLRLLGMAVCVVAAALIYLEAGAANEPLVMPKPADHASPSPPAPRKGVHLIRFLFGGGGKEHHVEGVVHGITLDQATELGIPGGSLAVEGDGVRFAFQSPPAALIGFGVVLMPGPLRWELTLDGSPWPRDLVFAGPYGLVAPDLVNGMGASCARGFAMGGGTPYFSAKQVGAFVICEER